MELEHGTTASSGRASSLVELPVETLTIVLCAAVRRDWRTLPRAACCCHLLRDAALQVSNVALVRTKQACEVQVSPPSRSRRFKGEAERSPAPMPWWHHPLDRHCSLTALHLSDGWLDDERMVVLLTLLKRHSGLTWLSLVGPVPIGTSGRVGPDGAEALAQWLRAHQPRLRALSLVNAAAGVSGVRALSGALSQVAATLRSLCLVRCGLLKADVRPLTAALSQPTALRTLTRVSLASNRLGAGGALALCSWLSRPECRCQILDLTNCDLDCTAAAFLCLALAADGDALHAALLAAAASAAGSTAKRLEAVCRVPLESISRPRGEASQLRVLLLARNVIGVGGAAAIAALLAPPVLLHAPPTPMTLATPRTAAFSSGGSPGGSPAGSPAGSPGGSPSMRSPPCSCLARVDLRRNGLGNSGLEALASALDRLAGQVKRLCRIRQAPRPATFPGQTPAANPPSSRPSYRALLPPLPSRPSPRPS